MRFGFIKKFFSMKAKSLEEFISLLKREGCGFVEAGVVCREKGWGTNTAAVGWIGNFKYSIEFTSESPNGRKIIYEKAYGERFGSTRGFTDAEHRGRVALACLVTAEAILARIWKRLPEIRIVLIGKKGEAFSTEEYQQLHADAEKYNIKPALS